MKKSLCNKDKLEEQVTEEQAAEEILTTTESESQESTKESEKRTESDNVESSKGKKEKASETEYSKKAKKAKKKKKTMAYFKIELEEDQPITLKIINRLINHFNNVLIQLCPFLSFVIIWSLYH